MQVNDIVRNKIDGQIGIIVWDKFPYGEPLEKPSFMVKWFDSSNYWGASSYTGKEMDLELLDESEVTMLVLAGKIPEWAR